MNELTHVVPVRLPPQATPSVRAWRWVRQSMFPSVGHSLLTLLVLALLAWCIPKALNWLVLDATFVGSTRDACNPHAACWLPVIERWNLFVYGFYPEAQRWRVNLAFLLAVGAFVLLFFKRLDRRALLAYLVMLPLLMWWLLKGGAGLPGVSSTQFAGMTVTVMLGTIGMIFALPLGILLAL